MDEAMLVWHNDGSGRFDRSLSVTVGDRPQRIVSEDFDGDGWPDLAVMNTGGEGRLCVLRNIGGGGFGPPVYYCLGDVRDLASADLDGDGDMDLVTSNWSEVSLSLLLNQRVTLGIYDGLGRRVCTLVNALMPSGHHTIPWNGRDALGYSVASGRYVVRLQAGAFSQGRTMTLIR